MQAVILAAGNSTRTYPLTIVKPKPLLKAANTTIIEHNLEQLQGIIDEAIIIIGYCKDMIKDKLGDRYKKIRIKYVEQREHNGSGGAIVIAESLLKKKFVVMNGDDFFSNKDIQKCIRHSYCILVKEVPDLRRFGEVIIKDKEAIDLKEKPKEEKKGLANTGLYVFTKDIFKYQLKKSERGEYEITDYIKLLVNNNIKVNYENAEFWLPITYPWNLLEANEVFLSSIKSRTDGTVEKGATIKGPVIIGKRTVIKAGAYIDGPVIIGEDCKIGPNCYIRAKTTIGNNSKIGNAVEVKNSIIGDNTSIGHLSYVGDSVIGDNVNLGAGTITANLRHDDKTISSPVKGGMVDSGRRKLGAIISDNVHTGINTSIYPGRKIWPDKTTLPGEIVDKDKE
jgi:UDP-N-acetylglucosamine diphosphorylase / glucose-1-phosphate thymidylyltransferase / UDP-N-acetylgalactosamine diphosphorylase / glucosamine-1-phosphate N-acetyltransferase / galactosamine-1-phosphate N-acetyltransferase